MKILCIHATAGAGHLKAAEAIHNGLIKHTEHQSFFVDALDYTNPIFQKLYPKSYAFIVSRLPKLWGFFFALLDQVWIQPLMRWGRRIYNYVNTKRLREYLIAMDFDYIISTQFLSNEVASALKRKGKIRAKIITVVTDFDVHRIWLSKGVDYYCVASDWTKRKILTLGVSEENVFVTGIPTDEKFSVQRDVVQLKAKLGLHKDIFTVLVATGSFGMGPIEGLIEACQGMQVVVICGHNKALYERLIQKNYDLVKVNGLVDNMYEFMAVSDVMVTKPGGLSISEALVSELPMIFFSAIPGQETNNVKVLKEYEIGISDKSIQEISQELKRFQSSKDVHMTALKKTKRLARPNAVNDIIALIQ
ncbi:MAG: hypothetical protein KC733_00655 [Candidatus Omnitrophica bacterium]|nr:hypothetical protein [Candidatus Omnitrophota bacterium]